MLNLSVNDDLDDIIEKPINRIKSLEELRCHTIDESLNEFGKTLFLLSSNNEAQIIVGIRSIPHLLNVDKHQCIHKIFPQFKETCFLLDLNRTLEFYQTLNSTLIDLLIEQRLTPKEFVNHFVILITNKINLYSEKPNDYEISTIYQYWTDLMFRVVEHLPEILVKSAIFDSIPHVKLQHLSRRAREYLSLLLAKCAPKLTFQIVKNQLYPLLSDLCNDTQYEIRAISCKSFVPVCKIFGSELSTEVVLPEIFKYLCDESTLVKTACFLSLIEILEIFNNYETKTYLLKKIQSFIEYGMSIRDENYLLVISKCFGSIITSFNDIMNTQTKMFYVDIFYQLCKNETLFSKRSLNESKFNWNTCKINLANNFSSILLMTNSINFESKLSQCFTALVRDKNENVREAIITKFIEIAQKLGPSQYHLLINDYCASLTDDSTLVQTATVNQLEKFFGLFVKKESSNGILNETQQMPGYQLVLKRLIQLESTISQSYKYTIHALILEAFGQLPWLISTENLVEKVLPILEQRLDARALPVRKACVKSMLKILRKVPLQKIRFTYLNRLLGFSTHKNCYKRAFYVEVCKMVMELYSKNFFKNYFYQSLIQLSNDPVVNVRICFLKVLVGLKKIWKFQQDRDKLDSLEKVAKNLLNDQDRDVYELAQKAIVQMDSINIINSKNEHEEKINRIREEEENLLLEMEPKKFKSSSFSSTNNSQNQNGYHLLNSASKSARPLVKMNKTSLVSSSTKAVQNQLQLINSNSELNNRIRHESVESTFNIRSQNVNALASGAEKNKLKPRRNSVGTSNTEFYSGSHSTLNGGQNGRVLIKKK